MNCEICGKPNCGQAGLQIILCLANDNVEEIQIDYLYWRRVYISSNRGDQYARQRANQLGLVFNTFTSGRRVPYVS